MLVLLAPKDPPPHIGLHSKEALNYPFIWLLFEAWWYPDGLWSPSKSTVSPCAPHILPSKDTTHQALLHLTQIWCTSILTNPHRFSPKNGFVLKSYKCKEMWTWPVLHSSQSDKLYIVCSSYVMILLIVRLHVVIVSYYASSFIVWLWSVAFFLSFLLLS